MADIEKLSEIVRGLGAKPFTAEERFVAQALFVLEIRGVSGVKKGDGEVADSGAGNGFYGVAERFVNETLVADAGVIAKDAEAGGRGVIRREVVLEIPGEMSC